MQENAQRFALAAAGERMILSRKTAEALKMPVNRAESRRPLHAVLGGVCMQLYRVYKS
jgi:hypothetical protein